MAHSHEGTLETILPYQSKSYDLHNSANVDLCHNLNHSVANVLEKIFLSNSGSETIYNSGDDREFSNLPYQRKGK